VPDLHEVGATGAREGGQVLRLGVVGDPLLDNARHLAEHRKAAHQRAGPTAPQAWQGTSGTGRSSNRVEQAADAPQDAVPVAQLGSPAGCVRAHEGQPLFAVEGVAVRQQLLVLLARRAALHLRQQRRQLHTPHETGSHARERQSWGGVGAYAGTLNGACGYCPGIEVQPVRRNNVPS
jgi:hypothetical protein